MLVVWTGMAAFVPAGRRRHHRASGDGAGDGDVRAGRRAARASSAPLQLRRSLADENTVTVSHRGRWHTEIAEAAGPRDARQVTRRTRDDKRPSDIKGRLSSRSRLVTCAGRSGRRPRCSEPSPWLATLRDLGASVWCGRAQARATRESCGGNERGAHAQHERLGSVHRSFVTFRVRVLSRSS